VLFAVNAGGLAYAAQDGIMYSYDRYYVGGSEGSATDPIAQTEDDTLYQSERWGTFSYHFPVKAGTYDIDLHMVEAWYGPAQAGSRVFNVEVEGETLVQGFNPLTAGHDVAQVISLTDVEVTDGELTLNFAATMNEANVAAIVVRGLAGNAGEGDPSVTEGTVGDDPVPADCSGAEVMGANDFVLFDGGKFSPGAGEIELHGKWTTFNVWNDAMGLSIVDAGAGSALKFSNAGIYQGFKIAPPKVGGVLKPFKIEGMDVWMQMQQGNASAQQVTFGMRITFPGEQQNQGGDPSTTWMYDASKQDAGISNVATVPKTCTLVRLKTPASWDAATKVADRFIFETKSNLSASDGVLIRRIVLKGVQFAD
jgi:hypothetical protein